MVARTGDPVYAESPSSSAAVVAALELEARSLEHTRFAVYCSGPGPNRAARTARQAIDAGASALLSFGLAGGLDRDLPTGTVILAEKVLDATNVGGPEGIAVSRPDAAWQEWLAKALLPDIRVTRAALVSVDRVVVAVAEKAALARRYDAAAVDMESAAIGREAARAGLPFAVLRVVADAADDALPAKTESLVTADGGTRLSGLLGFLATPHDIPALIRLALRSRRARAVLGRISAKLAALPVPEAVS